MNMNIMVGRISRECVFDDDKKLKEII